MVYTKAKCTTDCVNHKLLTHNEDEFFIEIVRDTFRTKIMMDFEPDENFKGIAVCCNYHFKGHPIGYLRDNNLVIKQIDGRMQRATFEIGESVIQAGPTLVENFEAVRDFKSEGFATHYILKGLHSHIGLKKSGNIVFGFTRKNTLKEITDKYMDLSTQNAIKLPGLKQCSFFCNLGTQYIKEGVFPIPVALVIEARLHSVSNLSR